MSVVMTNSQVEGQQEFIIEATDVSEMRCWLIAIQASYHHYYYDYYHQLYHHYYYEEENKDVWGFRHESLSICKKSETAPEIQSVYHQRIYNSSFFVFLPFFRIRQKSKTPQKFKFFCD